MKAITKIVGEGCNPSLPAAVTAMERAGRPVCFEPEANINFFVFRVEGGDTEILDHLFNRVIPALAKSFGDQRLKPAEVVDFLNLLLPAYADLTTAILVALEEAAKAVADDGKVSLSEGLKIAFKIISAIA